MGKLYYKGVEYAGGGSDAGGVVDVQVDNQSVVVNGVAKVDLTGKQDALTAGSGISINENNVISATSASYTAGDNIQISEQGVISATDTTYSEFTGATAQADGSAGLVKKPLIADKDKYLKGDGTWGTPSGGGGGSTVTITPTLSSGTKIADFEIDGNEGELYAPSGGGGDEAEEMTKAQYDALTSQQKNDGTIRFITDYNPPSDIPAYSAGFGINISSENVISVDHYKQNDSVSTSAIVMGLSTDSYKKLRFNIPLSKPMSQFSGSSIIQYLSFGLYNNGNFSYHTVVNNGIVDSKYSSAYVNRDRVTGCLEFTIDVDLSDPSGNLEVDGICALSVSARVDL